jgi:hypothetical protein
MMRCADISLWPSKAQGDLAMRFILNLGLSLRPGRLVNCEEARGCAIHSRSLAYDVDPDYERRTRRLWLDD